MVEKFFALEIQYILSFFLPSSVGVTFCNLYSLTLQQA